MNPAPNRDATEEPLLNIVLATSPIDIAWNSGSFPPLGLLYLAANIKNLPGVRVKIVDAFCEGLNVDQTAERILALSPDVVGVSVMSTKLENLPRLLGRIKAARHDTLTLAGGLHATLFDRLLLKEIPELDLVLRGEAEESFLELGKRLLAGKETAGLPGLSYRAQGKVIRGEPQQIEDLDSLPFPDRSLLDYPGYGKQWYGFELPLLPRFTTAFSSRGCLFNCTFCAGTKLSGNRLRIRSAENVLQELLVLSQEGYEFVIFFDDNFTGNVDRLDKLCHLIIEHIPNMRLACAGTLHHVPDATLDLMHRAGFDLVFLGVESGSDEQLRRYRKPTTRKQLATDIIRTKKAHIATIASFITGGLGETDQDHEATRTLVWEVMPIIAEINPLMVHPGSCLWDEIHGSQEPKTLKESESLLVSNFPGQMDKATLKFRERDFRRTFLKSWLHWRRIFDFLDLLRHNRLIGGIIKDVFRTPQTLFMYLLRQNYRE